MRSRLALRHVWLLFPSVTNDSDNALQYSHGLCLHDGRDVQDSSNSLACRERDPYWISDYVHGGSDVLGYVSCARIAGYRIYHGVGGRTRFDVSNLCLAVESFLSYVLTVVM